LKKANYTHRILAKLIDVAIVSPFLKLGFMGGVFAATYLLLSDGYKGRSLGKLVVGLEVRVKALNGEWRLCDFKDSFIRNLIFGVVVFSQSIPILGFFLVLLGLGLIAVEIYFIYMDEQGIRLGDIFADSKVVDLPKS